MRKFLQSRQKKTRINFFCIRNKRKSQVKKNLHIVLKTKNCERKNKNAKKTDEIPRDPPGGHRSTAARCSPRLRRRSSVGGQLAGEVAARVRAIAPPWAASSPGRPAGAPPMPPSITTDADGRPRRGRAPLRAATGPPCPC